MNRDFSQLADVLSEYAKATEVKVEKITDDVGSEATKKVSNLSPRDTGRYATGWKLTKSGGDTSIIIHNKNSPSLTHLLEFGHAKRGGGRTKAINHIAQTQEWAEGEVLKRIEREAQE